MTSHGERQHCRARDAGATKTCEICGEDYFRPPHQREHSWRTRRYCGERCKNKNHNNRAMSPLLGAAQYERSCAAASCTAHLRALLRYGFKHNGLPGLPAERFRAVAADNGFIA